jgi:hypothetical protein
MDLTKEESRVTAQFLERVNVNGKEADALVYLKQKFVEFSQEEVKETKKK